MTGGGLGEQLVALLSATTMRAESAHPALAQLVGPEPRLSAIQRVCRIPDTGERAQYQ